MATSPQKLPAAPAKPVATKTLAQAKAEAAALKAAQDKAIADQVAAANAAKAKAQADAAAAKKAADAKAALEKDLTAKVAATNSQSQLDMYLQQAKTAGITIPAATLNTARTNIAKVQEQNRLATLAQEKAAADKAAADKAAAAKAAADAQAAQQARAAYEASPEGQAAAKALADAKAAADAKAQADAQAAAARAKLTTDLNNQLASVKTADQLSNITKQAQDAGISLNAAALKNANTQAASDLQSQLTQAKTQDQLDSVLKQAQDTGITLNQGYVDRAKTIVQQQVQAQAAAEKAAADAQAQADAVAAQRAAQAQAQADAQAKQQADAAAAAEQARAATQASLDAANAKKAQEAAAYQTQLAARQAEIDQQKIQQFSTDPAYKAEIDRLTAAGQPFTFDDVTRAVQATAQARSQQEAQATNAALTNIQELTTDPNRAAAVEQTNLAALADNPRYSEILAEMQASGKPFSYTDVISAGDAAAQQKFQQEIADTTKALTTPTPLTSVSPDQVNQQNIQKLLTTDSPALANYRAEAKRLSDLGQPFTYQQVLNNVAASTANQSEAEKQATNAALTNILLPESSNRAAIVEQSNLAALAKNPRYSGMVAQFQATGKPFSYTDVIRAGDAAAQQKSQQEMAALRAAPTQEMQGGGLGEFFSSDLGKLLIIAGVGYALYASGAFAGFGGASVGDISAAAEGLASEGMGAADIATELSNTFGIDATAAETAANLATEVSSGAIDAASLLPETLTPEMLATAAETADPIAALNASAGWGASDVGYLQSIGATPDLIATAGANNIALGYDAYGMNILNAAETADIMSGVNPAFTNFLTEEAAGSAASEALGSGLTMGSSGLGMTAGTVPGLATMGGAGGLTIPAAGGGILSELGVFFPGALALAAIGGSLGAGAAAAGLPAGSVVEPPLSPLTPAEAGAPKPATNVDITQPPPVETPVVPEGPMGPPAPVEPPPAPPASELGGFKPGTAPGSNTIGLNAGTGVPPIAEMGGGTGLTIPAAGGGTLSAGGVTAAGAGGAALLGNLGQGAAAAGVPAGTITEPIAPAPQPNLTEMGGGKGLNPAAPAEPGLTAGSGAPGVAEMGGAQGLTIPAAGGGTLTQAGVAAGAGSALTGSLGTASDAVATSLPSNTSVPTTSGAVSPGPEVIDRAPDWTNPNPTPDKSVLQQVKDATGLSTTDLIGAGASIIGAATAPTPKKWAGWAPIDPLSFKHLGPLETPGTNPGYFVGATPFYNTRSPVQSEFYWGQHPYQTGAGFSQGQYNTVPNAPVAPWGLQEMYTPTDIPTYLASLKTNAARSLAAPVKATKV